MKILEYLMNDGTIFDSGFTFPEWLDSDLQEKITSILAFNFGLRNLQKRVEVIADVMDRDIWEVVPMLVYTLSVTRDYAWQTLLATESFEYNPIENYDRSEAESITRNQGAQSNSNTVGATHETVAEGAHTDTTTESRSAENSSGYQPDAQTQTAYGAISTTTEANARSDSSTIGARQDSETRRVTIHGNIGVTSSQDLIKQQREIANFSALYEIAHDIANEIGEGVF